MSATIIPFPNKVTRGAQQSNCEQPANDATVRRRTGFNGRTTRQEWLRQMAKNLIVERMKGPAA